MTALVIVVEVLSGVLGLLVQRRLAKHVSTESQDSAEGIPLTDLLSPVRILGALVLAFVLVQTFSSYEDASDAANGEAWTLLGLTTLICTASLLVILDLDRPFGAWPGLTRRPCAPQKNRSAPRRSGPNLHASRPAPLAGS